MPVHFNSIMKKEDEKKVLNSILEKNFNKPDDIFVSKEKDKFLIFNNIIDKNTDKIIGKTTITFITRNNSHELVDIDITLNNSKKTNLLFEIKYDDSSESNEYYQVSNENGIHFDIETVGRYKIEKEEIVGTKIMFLYQYFLFN